MDGRGGKVFQYCFALHLVIQLLLYIELSVQYGREDSSLNFFKTHQLLFRTIFQLQVDFHFLAISLHYFSKIQFTCTVAYRTQS
jgi:hypothetical protein